MRVKSTWLPALLLLPLVGCGGGGGGGLDADLKFVPANPQAVGTVKVSEILASQSYKDLVAQFKDKGDPNAELKDQMGIPLNDISTLTFGVSGSGELAVVVKTSKAVTAADMVKNMKPKMVFSKGGPKEEPRKFKEVKVGNYTMQEEDSPFKPAAFCVVNPNTVVFSESAKSLQAILQRDKKADLTEGMKKSLAQGDKSRTVYIAVDTQAAMKNIPSAPPGEANPVAGLQQAANDIEGAVIEAGISKDSEVSVKMLCKNGDAATKLKTEVDGLVALGKLFITPMAKDMGPMTKDLTQVLDSIKVEAKGSQVALSAKGNAMVVALMAIQTLGQSAQHTFEKVGTAIDTTPIPPQKK